jgi:hypothetical protein
MPKLYEYFGLVLFFYSNEHDPVHVHGRYQGRECRAVITITDGVVVGIEIEPVIGKRPLEGAILADFRCLVEARAEDIVQKWVDYFVYHRHISAEKITRKLT